MSQSTAAARSTTARPVSRSTGRVRPAPPRLQVVAPSTAGSTTRLVVVCVVLLVAGLMTLLWLNISLSRGAYDLDKAQASQQELVEKVQSLQEGVEAQRAPAHLAAAARRLGMVPQPNTAFLELDDGAVVGRPRVATAPPVPPTPAQIAAKAAADKATAARTAAAEAGAAKAAADKAAKAAAAKAAAKAPAKAKAKVPVTRQKTGTAGTPSTVTP